MSVWLFCVFETQPCSNAAQAGLELTAARLLALYLLSHQVALWSRKLSTAPGYHLILIEVLSQSPKWS